jgi:hypothetical protein
LIKDAIIENTILTNAKIDNVDISSRSISFISNLKSDVQLQLDNNSKQIGFRGKDLNKMERIPLTAPPEKMEQMGRIPQLLDLQ